MNISGNANMGVLEHETISTIYIKEKEKLINHLKKTTNLADSAIFEICQEALYIVFKKLRNNELEGIIDATKYLYGTAKNLALVEYRRSKQVEYRDFYKESLSSSEIGDIESDEFQTLEDVVRNVVKELTEPCKTILLSFYWKKMHYNEMLNILPNFTSSDSLKAQKNRCMQRVTLTIKQLFKDQGLAYS